MTIDWEAQTATIHARSVGTYTVVVENKTSVDPNNFVIPIIETTEDEDDFDVWEEFNATYFAALLLGLTLIYVAIAFIVDRNNKAPV